MKGDADAVIIAGISVSIAFNKLWLQSECTHRPPACTHGWPHGVTGIKTVINKLNNINNVNKCTLLINYAAEDLNSYHVTCSTNNCCQSALLLSLSALPLVGWLALQNNRGGAREGSFGTAGQMGTGKTRLRRGWKSAGITLQQSCAKMCNFTSSANWVISVKTSQSLILMQ